MPEILSRKLGASARRVRSLRCAGFHLILEMRMQDQFDQAVLYRHGEVVLIDDALKLTVNVIDLLRGQACALTDSAIVGEGFGFKVL